MSICTRPVPNCPECGDDLIHLSNRGPHESSSAFGQYVHDRGEAEPRWRQMYFMDIDGAVRKNKTKVLRIFEHKPQGGTVSDSQKEVLPLLAKSLQLLASTGLIHPQSGVFVLYSDHPHDRILVVQQRGWPSVPFWRPVEMTGQFLEDFLCGEVIDPANEPAAYGKAA